MAIVNLRTGVPVDPKDAAQKQWVEENFATPGSIPAPSSYDVTEMFDIPTQADVFCELNPNPASGRPIVRIHGVDNSGTRSALTIKAPIGLGSNFERSQDNGNPIWMIVSDGGPIYIPGDTKTVAIEISKETDTSQTEIHIPADAAHFDITYFARGGFVQRSYYVDTDGVYHRFSAADTPIENFCTNGDTASTISINGVDIVKSDIIQLTFGDDYLGVTELPRFWMYNYQQLRNLKFDGLKNVAVVGDNALNYCYGLTGLDFTPFASVVRVGILFTAHLFLKVIDISPMVALSNCGADFLSAMTGYPNFEDVQIGSLNFSAISTSSGLVDQVNDAPCILRADSQELADAFKAKFPNISEWTVVINS